MEFDTILLASRGVMYFATFVIIAAFNPRGARWRWGVSLFATGLAGSSLALCVYLVTDWPNSVTGGPQWLATLYASCVFGLVLRCRGNLAKLIPPFTKRAY